MRNSTPHPNPLLGKERGLSIKIAVALGLLAILAAPVHAQSSTPPGNDRESSDENELLMMDNPVVITAAQTKQRISDSPVAVSVITEDDIRKSGLTNVPDLLRSIPGVDVVQQNSGQANIAIRGLNAPFNPGVLVMVDGHSIYQDSFGGTFWPQEPLLISQIKQIEVVRGPGSVLYGANAFEGVINIITKTPAEMAKDGAVSTFDAVGDEHSQVEETSVTGSTGKNGSGLAYTIGAGNHGTNGTGQLESGQVRDSYSVPIFTFRGIQPVKDGSLDVAAAYGYGKTDLATPFTEYMDDIARTGRLTVDYTDDRSHVTVSGRSSATGFSAPNGSVDEETETNELTIQQQRDPSHRHEDILGASFRDLSVKSTLMGDISKSETLAALYGQDEFETSSNTHLFTGVRVDHNSIYGTDVTPRVSLVRHVDQQQTVRLSYSSAFEDPTMFDSYFNVTLPVAGLPLHFIGNTDTTPEKTNSVELGYRHDLPAGYIEATAFHNTITDLISTVVGGYVQPPGYPFPIPTTSSTANVGSATEDGVELDSRFVIFKRVNARINYAYLNALKDDSRAELSPRNHVNASLDTTVFRRVSAYLAMHYVDSDFVESYTPTRENIPSYVDFDAKVGYKFGGKDKPWELAVAATNVFNVPHQEVPQVLIDGQPSTAAIPRQTWLELSGGF